jgi:thiol:disulfide interchange protein
MIAGPISSETPPIWTLILGALVGGLILNIMPCVFPILSLKALSLARAGGGEARARSEGLAYTAGVVLACVALGALLLVLRAGGEQVGWAFQLQEPSVVLALLALATIITLNFAGTFELPNIDTSGGADRSAFGTGLLAAIAATPCTGPFMAAALGAALLLPAPIALLLFAMLGLGLAFPFLAIGFVPALRRLLPRPGPWMERFRRLMAIPMGLTALALLWLAVQLGGRGFALVALVVLVGITVALFVVGRLQRSGKMAWPAFGLVAAPFLIFGAFALPSAYAPPAREPIASLLEPRLFSRDALADARASGRPVFVWFTADWCVTCKVNESIAIEREATAAAFEEAGVVAMVGDWTIRDEAITAFLTEQGAAGVPLYLWYEPGAAEPEQLPQVLTPDMLVERAARSNP